MGEPLKNCNCQSGRSFQTCCEPLLLGTLIAGSPEQLMRSRYTAFCLKNVNYLQSTTDPETAALFDWNANRAWAEGCQFTNLKVVRSSEKDLIGHVEFIAGYTVLKTREAFEHHEFSTFRKHNGVWFYREGKTSES